MKTIVNYFYKIVVFVIYSTLVSTGVYYICSHLAPIPKLDMYFDLEWLLPKIISENKTMGIIAGYFFNLQEISMKAETITATMVFKEIFYAIVLAVFFKLGTTVYSCFSSFVSFLSNEKARHGWMVDGICMLALMITSVVFSSIVADTAFYFLLPQSYVVLLGIAGFVLLSLCMVAYICQRMISAKIGVVSRLKGIIGFVFEFILQLFAVILIYFTVLIYMELAYTENSLATYLVMIFSLIACIGLCTAIFVYYLQGIRLTKQTI